jgi:hypothetical protein
VQHIKDGRTALTDGTEKHRGRPRASYTDGKCVIVEGLIKNIEESKFVRHTEKKLSVTSHPLGKDQYHETVFIDL